MGRPSVRWRCGSALNRRCAPARPGSACRGRLHALSAELGPFPNARLNFETTGADGKEKRVADQPKKQENRQLKAACLVEVRIFRPPAAKWFRVGMPCCPVIWAPMDPEKPLPDEDGDDREEGAREEEALAELPEES